MGLSKSSVWIPKSMDWRERGLPKPARWNPDGLPKPATCGRASYNSWRSVEQLDKMLLWCQVQVKIQKRETNVELQGPVAAKIQKSKKPTRYQFVFQVLQAPHHHFETHQSLNIFFLQVGMMALMMAQYTGYTGAAGQNAPMVSSISQDTLDRFKNTALNFVKRVTCLVFSPWFKQERPQ